MKVVHPNRLSHLESVYLHSDSQTLRAGIPAYVPHTAEALIFGIVQFFSVITRWVLIIQLYVNDALDNVIHNTLVLL